MKKKRAKENNWSLYVLLVAVLIILGWTLYTFFKPQKASSLPDTQNFDACGDLNDLSNIQHLSHHPSQYADCIKKVSPDKFKQATEFDKNAFMQQNGIS